MYCQQLHEDCNRKEFCEVVAKLNEDPAFIRKLKFSNECVFSLESRIKQQNIHYYVVKNSQVRICHCGKTVTLIVWLRIGLSRVVERFRKANR